MDLIHTRYSSPFFYLDLLIENNRFSESIDTLYKQIDEEKMWQLYLSNPIKEKSYFDWKDEVVSKNHEENHEFEVAKDMNDIKDKSRNILKNFKPQ